MSSENVNKIVYKYLCDTNRPHSINDIIEKLGKDVGGKSSVQKALDYFVLRKEVTEKVYKKQKIYTISQNNRLDNENLRKEIKKITDEQTAITTEIKMKENLLKNLDIQLNSLITTMTNDEIERENDNLELSITALKNQIMESKKNSITFDVNNKDKIEKNHSNYLKEYKKRKKLATEMLDAIMEGYPKTKKQLIEDTGIETDEMVEFVLKQK